MSPMLGDVLILAGLRICHLKKVSFYTTVTLHDFTGFWLSFWVTLTVQGIG